MEFKLPKLWRSLEQTIQASLPPEAKLLMFVPDIEHELLNNIQPEEGYRLEEGFLVTRGNLVGIWYAYQVPINQDAEI